MSTSVKIIEKLYENEPNEAHIFIAEALLLLASSVKKGNYKAPLQQLNTQAAFMRMAEITLDTQQKELDLYIHNLRNKPWQNPNENDLKNGVFVLVNDNDRVAENDLDDDPQIDWEEIERDALKDLEDNPDNN